MAIIKEFPSGYYLAKTRNTRQCWWFPTYPNESSVEGRINLKYIKIPEKFMGKKIRFKIEVMKDYAKTDIIACEECSIVACGECSKRYAELDKEMEDNYSL